MTVEALEAVRKSVVVAAPPARLAFTWEVHRDAETHVEIRFTPEGDGTRVDLVHSGWTAEEARRSYDDGWEFVLGRFRNSASG